MNSVETAIGQGTQEPSPKWRERLKALCSNTPPIVRMVWKSAPRVVVASLSARLAASLIPLAMLAVTKLIIDAIYALLSHQHALPAIFWWLVVLEFALASLGTILVRVLDFCDSVLADKFTRHISTRIVKHAARLDLTSYEDPLFYDMMERARVQGTDRLIMIQSAGTAVPGGHNSSQPGGEHFLLFSVASFRSHHLRRSGFPRRDPLRIPGLFAKFPPDYGSPPDGLPEGLGRE